MIKVLVMKVFFQIKKRLRNKIITNKAVKIITKLKMKLNLAKPLPLYFSGFFLLPLPKNAQKRTKKKLRKYILGLVGSSRANQIYGGARLTFFF